jgi:hypothetical protein
MNDEHEKEEEEERDPFPMGARKATEIREILSEEVYNSGMYSSENSLAYVSQLDNKYGTINTTPKTSKRGSSKALQAENYIDAALLNRKSTCLTMKSASGATPR